MLSSYHYLYLKVNGGSIKKLLSHILTKNSSIQKRVQKGVLFWALHLRQ
jgi:hypothetical protein